MYTGKYLLSDEMKQYEPWFALRAAIIRQAIVDWEAASDGAKRYILTRYAKYPEWKRREIKTIAQEKHVRWCEAADTYDFFHDGRADKLLCDTPYTGRDVWRMLISGDWNRGGIKDKPYKTFSLPSSAECALPIDPRFGDAMPFMRNNFIFAFSEAEKSANKRREKKKKEGDLNQ